MTAFVVRALTEADWEFYRSVRLAALADSPECFGSSVDRERAFPESVWRERLVRRNQFVALRDGQAEGLAGVVPLDEGTAELVSVWVRPQARGHGYGDALVRAALDWAAEHGCRAVHLSVVAGNRPAERLFRRHGFRRQVPQPPGTSGEFRMVLRLTPADAPR